MVFNPVVTLIYLCGGALITGVTMVAVVFGGTTKYSKYRLRTRWCLVGASCVIGGVYGGIAALFLVERAWFALLYGFFPCVIITDMGFSHLAHLISKHNQDIE